jgi:hypothetical protein
MPGSRSAAPRPKTADVVYIALGLPPKSPMNALGAGFESLAFLPVIRFIRGFMSAMSSCTEPRLLTLRFTFPAVASCASDSSIGCAAR